MIKKIFFFVILLFPMMTFAVVPSWQIVPDGSVITFTATQNNAPVTGKFTRFKGDIDFDPAQLKQSHVNIVVDTTSVTTDYADIAKTLKTTDWFDVATFPEAVFTASDFTKTGDKTYQANGELTIRNKKEPAMISFTLDEFSDKTAHVSGKIQLKRLTFGVGQGEWQKTDNVKDEVSVQFTVNAVRK